MDDEKLLPCPFCGSSDVVEERSMDGARYVQCQTEECEATAHRRVWNTRPSTDTGVVERAAAAYAAVDGDLPSEAGLRAALAALR